MCKLECCPYEDCVIMPCDCCPYDENWDDSDYIDCNDYDDFDLCDFGIR